MAPSPFKLGDRVQHLVGALLGKEVHSSLYGRLSRSSMGMCGLMVASTGLSLVISLLLARLLGVEGYGAYAYAMAWIGLLGVPALLGLKGLLVRKIAAYQTQSAWGLMGGLLRWANQVALFASVGLALLAAVGAWAVTTRSDWQMLSVFWVSLIMLPLITLAHIRQSTLQGLHNVVIGQMPEMLVQPILFIVLIGGAYLLFGKGLTAPWAMTMNVAAVGVAFLIGARLLHKTFPQAAKEAVPAYQTSVWMRSALPLLFVAAMHVISARTDTIMLGAIKGVEVVAIYAIAKRGAGLIPFVMLAVNAAVAPTIASLYERGDIKQLQRVATKSARVSLYAALPVAVGLILFGNWFLMIFGRDFTQGQATLAILSAGQLINVAMGSVALLLIMTGHEHDAAMGIGVSAVLNIILNAILIPQWGLIGAAVATTSSMIVWNGLLAIRVYKRLGVHSTVLGKVNIRRKA